MSTLANARDVLHLMADLRQDLTVTQVSEHLRQPKSSISRTLALMAQHGFLERDPETMAYRPGPLVVEAAFRGRASRGITELLHDAVASLVDQTGYTSYVNVLSGAETLVIHMQAGHAGRLQVYTPEGSRGPAYATSMGRAILARLSDDEVISVVGDDFRLATGSAPTSTGELLTRLAVVRARGYSISRGEIVENVAGVSAAVVDVHRSSPYGLGVALPATELDQHDADLARIVRSIARDVGTHIGDAYWLESLSDPPDPGGGATQA